MTFSLHESIEPNRAFEHMEKWIEARSGSAGGNEVFPLINEKLNAPMSNSLIDRVRLVNLIKRSQEQFPATLISGRSGTGKTAIAAAVAARSRKAAWYSVESTDTDWPLFARYLSASLGAKPDNTHNVENPQAKGTQNEIATFLARHLPAGRRDNPSLIVLDDIHHIFDAPWFADFFNLFLYSLPAESHLLLLCRSKPPSPLWRLRSKQMLNVIDEKVLAFSQAEAEALFASLNIPAELAADANGDCFGRVSKLIEYAHQRSTILPPSINT
jgi:ATP/maltotriose-dependent transcriptional regulator MalT